MSDPRRIVELDAEQRAFYAQKEKEIDALYASFRERINEDLFCLPPGGWPKPEPLTWRQRARIWSWKARRGLAAPFVAIVRWLAPDELRSEDE